MKNDIGFTRYLLQSRRVNPNISKCSLPLHIAVTNGRQRLSAIHCVLVSTGNRLLYCSVLLLSQLKAYLRFCLLMTSGSRSNPRQHTITLTACTSSVVNIADTVLDKYTLLQHSLSIVQTLISMLVGVVFSC